LGRPHGAHAGRPAHNFQPVDFNGRAVLGRTGPAAKRRAEGGHIEDLGARYALGLAPHCCSAAYGCADVTKPYFWAEDLTLLCARVHDGGSRPNGKARLTLDQAGSVTLVRLVPTPGLADVQLEGNVTAKDASVTAQIWQDGKQLAEKSGTGLLTVRASVATDGMVRYAFQVKSGGPAHVAIEDLRISVTKQR
jgi:hypothetical protein